MQTLQRWLVARKMKQETARADLMTHAAWRAAHVPNGRISEEEVWALGGATLGRVLRQILILPIAPLSLPYLA